MRVNKEGIDYQLGTIITRIEGQNGKLTILSESINILTEKINDLPCISHDLRLEALENKRLKCNESKLWSSRNRLTFKQTLLITVVGAIIGSAMAVITIILV